MQLGWPHKGCLQCGTLTHGALLQVAGLRGLILRSQLIVLLKHKVGDAASTLFGLCLLSQFCLRPLAACLGGAGRGSLSSPSAHQRDGGCCPLVVGLPQHHPAPQWAHKP